MKIRTYQIHTEGGTKSPTFPKWGRSLRISTDQMNLVMAVSSYWKTWRWGFSRSRSKNPRWWFLDLGPVSAILRIGSFVCEV